MKKSIYVCALCAMLLMSGCGGRTANPIATKEIGDKNLDCESLEAEMSELDRKARRLLGEHSNKTGKNAAWALGGLILWPLLFGLDLSDAERQEAQAMQDRHSHLLRLYNKKDCDDL